MRAGQVVETRPIADWSEASLAESMVGRKVTLGRPEGLEIKTGEVRLQATGLSLKHANGVPALKDVSLSLRAGEIVGVAGVSG
ncbi:ABC transporter ATP-binding protein, partial [Acinetobacter baumannii]